MTERPLTALANTTSGGAPEMVYCLQASVAFATAANRDTQLAALVASINGQAKWGVTTATAVQPPEPGFWLWFEARFVSEANQQALDNRLENFRGGPPANRPTGGWVRLHPCPHDEAGQACPDAVTTRTFP